MGQRYIFLKRTKIKTHFSLSCFSLECVSISKGRKYMERKVEHKSVSRQVEEIKALSEDILEYRSIDVQKAGLRMERRVGRQAVRRTLSLLFTRAAVILVLPLLFSSLLFSYLYYAQDMTRSPSLSFMLRLTPCPGTITRFVLPDQSVVWLNSGSKLTYPSVFEGEKSARCYFPAKDISRWRPIRNIPFVYQLPKVYGWWPMEQNLMSMPMLTNLYRGRVGKGKIDVIRNDERIRLSRTNRRYWIRRAGTFSVSAANPEGRKWIGKEDG